MNDDDKAMAAVIDDMGRAAKGFKLKKYAPKPPPAAAPVEQPPEVDGAMPTVNELAQLLGE